MNLKFSGFLFVLIVILEAINGLALKDSHVVKKEDLTTVRPESDKSQKDIGTTAESVKIITPPDSDPKSNVNDDKTTTTTTSTTTPKPAPAPTPAPAPVPTPVPEKGMWVVNYTSDPKRICVIASAAMQLNITYPAKDESFKSVLVNVPKNAVASGNCSSNLQNMTISWGPGHTLQINFTANETTKNFFISGMTLDINATVFNDYKYNATTWHFVNSSVEFVTPLEMSYKCNRMQLLNFKSNDETLKTVLALNGTQFEAFVNKTKAEFGAAQDCDSFDTPDIVPIAVGCALAILVLVVLVAYLIGRRRSQNRGYLSM